MLADGWQPAQATVAARRGARDPFDCMRTGPPSLTSTTVSEQDRRRLIHVGRFHGAGMITIVLRAPSYVLARGPSAPLPGAAAAKITTGN